MWCFAFILGLDSFLTKALSDSLLSNKSTERPVTECSFSSSNHSGIASLCSINFWFSYKLLVNLSILTDESLSIVSDLIDLKSINFLINWKYWWIKWVISIFIYLFIFSWAGTTLSSASFELIFMKECLSRCLFDAFSIILFSPCII